MKEATNILHSIPADPQTGAFPKPIYQKSTFEQEEPATIRGLDYTRKLFKDLKTAITNVIAKTQIAIA